MLKKTFCILLTLCMLFSLSACSSSKTTSTKEEPVPTQQQLDPNLMRLQGSWAASANYEQEDYSFLCPMPASWDEDRQGYYVLTIDGNDLTFQQFYKGQPSRRYSGEIRKEVYTINNITEKSSDEHQTIVSLNVTSGGQEETIDFRIFDNREIFRNSFVLTSFVDLMFVKLNDSEYDNLMDIRDDIQYDNQMHQELRPYVGMPKEQLKHSTWGSPDHINTTETSNHIHEQWCYSGNRYVYVVDDYVESIQDYD